MVFGMLPATALAGSGGSGNPTTEAELTAAISSANGPTTIVLGDNIDLTETIAIENGKNITLDLNDKVLKQTQTGKRTFIIATGGVLTITDDAASKTPKYFTVTDNLWALTGSTTGNTVTGGVITGCKCNGKGGAILVNGGTLTLSGGAIVGNTAT